MATDKTGITAYPYTDVVASVSAAETITFDADRVSLVQVYIDDAGGGTSQVGTDGSAVPTAGESWEPVWIAPRERSQAVGAVTITPDGSGVDIYYRLF